MLELATIDDRDAVLKLKQQVHAMHVSWRPDVFQMDEDLYPEEHFLEDIQARQVYVAKLDGTVVGYVRLVIMNKAGAGSVYCKMLLLEELCVDETLRGQGFGKEIVADVHALARAFGCDQMRIGVYPQNEPAIAFYQRCGFQIRSISMDKKL